MDFVSSNKSKQLTNLYPNSQFFSTFRSAAEGMSNGQRSAGDVLNDIGSMLSDLTDELDAMLHMERDPLKQ